MSAIPRPGGNSDVSLWFYRQQPIGDRAMLGWAITFLVVALIAAVLGFGGIAGTAVEIAKILFVVFLILFLVSLVWHLVSGRRPPI
ncbi:hypothetical protein TMPK1_19950 [Rhodospirillales bacterium TMPK1]|uniref:UPF0391 membrane protein TMPK1_19950 n=2 Tax=Roseiterribacter gracilis TaxID=2812848 RepID=A0A8S8X7P6_9PROT|nr:hypothetical protein TMPK1_19950 [Rhodospirillales bacterium TMPK1]